MNFNFKNLAKPLGMLFSLLTKARRHFLKIPINNLYLSSASPCLFMEDMVNLREGLKNHTLVTGTPIQIQTGVLTQFQLWVL